MTEEKKLCEQITERLNEIQMPSEPKGISTLDFIKFLNKGHVLIVDRSKSSVKVRIVAQRKRRRKK